MTEFEGENIGRHKKPGF